MTRILVVEDESSFSEALEFLLGKEGFTVVTAATGTGLGLSIVKHVALNHGRDVS